MSCQTDKEKCDHDQHAQTVKGTLQGTKVSPLLAEPADLEPAHKFPAFHFLTQMKAFDVKGIPKWKRNLMAKASLPIIAIESKN